MDGWAVDIPVSGLPFIESRLFELLFSALSAYALRGGRRFFPLDAASLFLRGGVLHNLRNSKILRVDLTVSVSEILVFLVASHSGALS